VNSLLVTGSSGLIGSEVCTANEGWKIDGVDNNGRALFFGPEGTLDGISDVFNQSHHSLDTTSWTFATARMS
jgi:nucleoside-diphosphate-sugar epimerase